MKEYVKRSGLSVMQIIMGVFGIVGGVWMILSSFVLNYSGITILDATSKKQVPVDLGAVTASDMVAGVILIILGVAALLITRSPLIHRIQQIATVGMIVVGLYLMAAPYLYDLLKVASYMGLDKPNTNDQLVGILAVLVGGFTLQRVYLSTEKADSETLQAAVTA